MKPLAIVFSLLAAAALVLVLVLRTDRAAPAPGAGDAFADRAARIEDRLDELARRLDALERRGGAALPAFEPIERASAGVDRALVLDRASTTPRDAAWYLDQYVASFDGGGEGSEYYRLVVDAHIAELVEPVCGLVLDPSRVEGLRIGLVRMLGKARFRGDARVLVALVGLLREASASGLELAAVEAWVKVGDESSARGLEAVLWRIDALAAREAALRALLELAGERANQVLLRLLHAAPDEASAGMLVALLDGADLDAALAFLQRASGMTKPTRLIAARRIGEFVQPPFQQLVEDWLRVEIDADVIAALGGAREQQRTIPGWAPMQATGAPNADPRRDDSRAWAPREQEMGLQWIQLEYTAADRITGVNVHETCSAGAVTEVRARDTGGVWHVLWSGTASSNLEGPLEIRFAPTSFHTQTLRVVLDTNRTPGWNEIDAVEFHGLSGTQWATGATAASSYAQIGSGRSFGISKNGLLLQGR